ncbi:MAG: hypothetical protein M3509_08750 [Chloroflexota bacterium]|nr:hypothetical protein [Chloroflexota bacterium]
MGEVSLQLATRRAPMMSAGPQAALVSAPGQLTIVLGPDEIVLDRVQVVLRKIRLDGAPTASCAEDAEGDAQCGEVRLGPVLFDLPLDDEAEPAVTALVPVGVYDRLKFQIHKPSNANGDATLVAEHPEMEDVSIRATGTYNGTPFVFASDLTEVEELSFAEAVEVAEDGELALTLHVDAADWFANETGTGLVDPAQANDGESYESEVEQNIRESFRAFRDADGDGVDD